MGIFKDINGKYSFGRVFTAVVILYYIASSSFIIYKTKQMPDIPDNLYLVLLALYGVNKLANAVELFKK